MLDCYLNFLDLVTQTSKKITKKIKIITWYSKLS